jgi:hypothetical protein
MIAKLPLTADRPTLHTVAVPYAMWAWNSTDFVVVGPAGRERLKGTGAPVFSVESEACTFGRELAARKGVEFAPGLYQAETVLP